MTNPPQPAILLYTAPLGMNADTALYTWSTHMKRKSILAFAAGVTSTGALALLIATGPDHGHDHGDHAHDHGTDKVTEPEMDQMMGMSPEAMMAAMDKLSTPDKHHAELLKSVGTWIAESSFVMGPAVPPAEGTGKMIIESVLGGRYVVAHFTMDFMGQPFEGIGYTGYDIAHEQYIGTWADTMSTKITYLKGNFDKNGDMVMSGMATTHTGDSPMKIVSTMTDDNHFSDKFYDQMPDGSWFNSGTISYSRVID